MCMSKNLHLEIQKITSGSCCLILVILDGFYPIQYDPQKNEQLTGDFSP